MAGNKLIVLPFGQIRCDEPLNLMVVQLWGTVTPGVVGGSILALLAVVAFDWRDDAATQVRLLSAIVDLVVLGWI